MFCQRILGHTRCSVHFYAFSGRGDSSNLLWLASREDTMYTCLVHSQLARFPLSALLCPGEWRMAAQSEEALAVAYIGLQVPGLDFPARPTNPSIHPSR